MSQRQNPLPPLVITEAGPVRGALAPDTTDIFRYAGLRYAAPPIGANRFRPPQPLTPWSDAQSAESFGPACYQDYSYDGFVWRRGEFARSEDCLFLNVWAPADAANLSVMVWFHGGSHTGGSGHARIFDGTALARKGVVLVTVNYRLGAFGFLAHPALAAQTDDDSSGNYGLMDKVAALGWVRDNIAGFGGDPDNVTIFGQSAGSMSVCALMAAEAGKGLFHKAIGQSAACMNPPLNPSTDPSGRAQGAMLSDHLGLGAAPDAVAAALRALSPEQLQLAANESGWMAADKIVVDGRLLRQPPRTTLLAGTHHAVPLLVGSLANEGVELLPLERELDEAQLRTRLDSLFPGMTGELLAEYSPELSILPGLAQRQILIDRFMTRAMRDWARANRAAGAPSYLYYMRRPTPIFALYTPDDPIVDLAGTPYASGPRSAGAYHSGDLAYVFGNTRLVGAHWEAADHALSEQMVGYWTNFAKTGNPNGSGLPLWPGYDAEHATLILDQPAVAAPRGVDRKRLDLLDATL